MAAALVRSINRPESILIALSNSGNQIWLPWVNSNDQWLAGITQTFPDNTCCQACEAQSANITSKGSGTFRIFSRAAGLTVSSGAPSHPRTIAPAAAGKPNEPPL